MNEDDKNTTPPANNVPTPSTIPSAPAPDAAGGGGVSSITGMAPLTDTTASAPPPPPPVATVPSAPAEVPVAPIADSGVPMMGASAIPSAPTMDGGTSVTPVAGNSAKKHGIGYYLMIVVLFLLIFGAIGFAVYKLFIEQPPIESYADCIAAGNAKIDGNPPQCKTADGTTFTQGVTGTDNEVVPTEVEKVEVLKIHFSKTPESNDDPEFTVAVERTPINNDTLAKLLEGAMTYLIAGPTAAEKTDGLFTPIKVTGLSNCGKDFTVTHDEAKATTTVKFCKPVDSAGVLEDARIKAVIEDTLNTEFDEVTKVIVLTKEGDCFGDQSGANLCLE